MAREIHKKPNETLDPENWDAFGKLMHQMVDDAIDFVKNIEKRPVWQDIPKEVEDRFAEDIPMAENDPTEVYEHFKENIMPYQMGNVHPKFWAWYMGSGNMMGVMGDFWASIFNPNMGGGRHAGNLVEEQVINWMKNILGYPEQSSGLLVSGGSMANFVGLAVGRQAMAGFDLRNEGLYGGTQRMTIYASTEIHSSNQKSLEMMGLGSKSLRKVRVNDDYTMDIDALKTMIKEDRKSGYQPICVIGTSGTINTGAIDDLEAIADLCEVENLWFHVDGAIGGIAVISPLAKPLLKGIERADSIAIDLHKWLHMPFEAGCALIREHDRHKETFSLIPEYLKQKTRGIASGRIWFNEYGPQLTRRFRALKIWMSIQTYGVEKLGRMITKNIEQANYLEEKILAHPNLKMIAPVGLDIVCFRYEVDGLSNGELNKLNEEIKIQLEEKGLAAPGYTTLGDVFCIRVAISNHRSSFEDFNDFLEDLLRIGERLRS